MVDGIRDFLADEGFRTGLLFGLAAVAVVCVLSVADRRVLPWGGLAFVAAGLLAIGDDFAVEPGLIAGLVVLAVAGFAVSRRSPRSWPLAALPGAVVFAYATELRDPGWAELTIVVATVVGGSLVADFDRAHGRWGLAPVLLAVSLVGIYVTTPETQHSILLTGAALPLVLLGLGRLGWPWPRATLGVGGAFAATALVAWTVVLDGSFRPSSVVGGLACLGMLAIEPVVRHALARAGVPMIGAEAIPIPVPPRPAPTDRARASGTARRRVRFRPEPPPPSPGEVRRAVVLAGLHLVVVVVCARVAGLRPSTAEAFAITAVVYVAAGVALAVTELRGRPAAGPHAASAFGHTERGASL
jgi:hypothetical protein